ncbi:hypothetical protein FHETE_10000 [Fusarium heterosporum]|uniref:Uncharacterized protein n=1 Tax=Fusarium heterosporum TaxID=42747 RepID=A0A8H5WD75_FUSHE|nr:hypothetical protein FHETE_10000 [Fusarium heterosporum]
MENTNYLLSLPYEMRDAIWTFCSTTGDANGLLGCCRQTKDEFTPHCVFPDDIYELDTLKILVDSTYDDGIWLRFDYSWEKDGYTHRAVHAVRDMDDAVAQRLLKISRFKEAVVHLHAPRRGHFVGALFMMLAKVDDGYYMIETMSRDVDPEQSDMGHVKLKFTTESRQPHQSAKEAKNFWECRSPKVLQEAIRKYWHRCGQMPCFYEYFLINVPYFFPHPPVIEYVTWPRRHVHRKEPLGADMMKRLILIHWAAIAREQMLDFLASRPEFQRKIAEVCAKKMTRVRFHERDRDESKHWKPATSRHHWQHLRFDTVSLRVRFQFWLDNIPGPAGGCMDMLRLHRFKTMGTSNANFFAREASERRSLISAATNINARLRMLFNPLVTDDSLRMRESCPHLRAVTWATFSADSSDVHSLRDVWLKHYPNGIRYNWSRHNLVQWRLQWRTRSSRGFPGEISVNGPRNTVQLHVSWECSSCCRDAHKSASELTDASEETCGCPVLVRRKAMDYVQRIVRKGCGYKPWGYADLTSFYHSWSGLGLSEGYL